MRTKALTLALAIMLGAVATRAESPLVNHAAPAFSKTDLTQKSVSLAKYKGKVVLLNFWATWCAPCQAEIPKFAAWQTQYGPQGFQVLGVSMDDEDAPVKKLVPRLKVNYPVVMGDARMGKAYGGVLGLPVTFLIDRNGTVRERFDGEANLQAMEQHVQQLLKK
ncbi:TlpA family protein disulfide reductase [Terriglobus tenax]|uniref:TlpA family protein disulfide reductase n=1 Tax=Terriglobus tenax TaxID=1111115 RepID=UPI0021DF51E4|nr:TlpA disulfide reductase family protein [Terriglobus tenax]